MGRAVAAAFVEAAQAVESFTVALAGGRTVEPLYRCLAELQGEVPWERVHVFWSDERYVSPTDPDSNVRMARELLLNHVPIPEENVHAPMCWFSVKMTARLDVNATPGVKMSPLAPGIVPECSGASRVKRATRAGFAALDTPSALWYSLLVGERERSGAPGIRVFMRAPCYYAAHAAPLVPAPVSGPAPTKSLGPCQP